LRLGRRPPDGRDAAHLRIDVSAQALSHIWRTDALDRRVSGGGRGLRPDGQEEPCDPELFGPEGVLRLGLTSADGQQLGANAAEVAHAPTRGFQTTGPTADIDGLLGKYGTPLRRGIP
jgi:hypothetical protein